MKESGVSAGVRRIEAVCGKSALALAASWREGLLEAQEAVKNQDILAGVGRLKEEIKTLKKEVQALASNSGETLQSVMLGGVEVVIASVGAGDIKQSIDELKNTKPSVAALLFQLKDDKIMIAAGVKNASLKAGEWIKEVAPYVGGGGGGRDDFAQAGGKNPAGLEEAKTAALSFAKSKLGV